MTAPYNFVRFPPSVITATKVWEASGLDRKLDPTRGFAGMLDGAVDGHIDVTITPLSPFLIGGAEGHSGGTVTLPAANGHHERLAVPGSGIRGMLRHSFTALLGDYLRLDPTPLRALDRPNPAERRGREEAADERPGLLRREENGTWTIHPVQAPDYRHGKRLGVRRDVVINDLVQDSANKHDALVALFGSTIYAAIVSVPQTPNESHPPAPMVIAVGATEADCQANADRRKLDANPDQVGGYWTDLRTSPGHVCSIGLQRAFEAVDQDENVMISQVVFVPSDLQNVDADGGAQPERIQYFNLFLPLDNAEPIACPGYVVDAFRRIIDRQYQQRILSRGQWSGGDEHWTLERIVAAMPGQGDHAGIPVFYTVDARGLADCMGIAPFLTRPESGSVNEAVKAAGGVWAREAGTTAVDSLFGRIGDGDEEEITGRLRFGWAYGPDVNTATRLDALDVVLLSPKITSRHMRREVITGHYRGITMYHHRGWNPDHDRPGWWRILVDEHNGDLADNQAIRTSVQPWWTESSFRCRIRFTNLTELELGLVLLILDPGQVQAQGAALPAFAHHLGGGRPLGLGAVHITATAVVEVPEKSDLQWPLPPTERKEIGPDAVRRAWEFLTTAWGEAPPATLAETGDHPMPEHVADWLTMLRWGNRPEHTGTAQMSLDDHALGVPLTRLEAVSPRHFPI